MGRYDSREGGGRARQEQALESNAGCSCRMRKRGSAGGAEFDLFALNAGNDDLYRPLGKELAVRYCDRFNNSSRFFLKARSIAFAL